MSNNGNSGQGGSKSDKPTFYMKVPLPDGSVTNGKIDYLKLPDVLGVSKLDLSGKRVLDVAANDGFWSFWAEQRGAKEVVATDIDSFERYDWGFNEPSDAMRARFGATGFSQWHEAGAGFHWIAKQWKSKVQRKDVSVYDLAKEGLTGFDFVFCFGLLYHLRHPLLSLDVLRKSCKGVLILETMVYNRQEDDPISYFYCDDAMKGHTNWTGATKAGVIAWLRSAGFPHVWVTAPNRNDACARQIFVAAIDETYADVFNAAPKLKYVQPGYYKRMRTNVRRSHGLLKEQAPSDPVVKLAPAKSKPVPPKTPDARRQTVAPIDAFKPRKRINL